MDDRMSAGADTVRNDRVDSMPPKSYDGDYRRGAGQNWVRLRLPVVLQLDAVYARVAV
jgi:hypothetical protein